jgi:phosphoglucosamine mutase
MSRYFGTDGFRGEAGGALCAAHAFRIGRFLGHHFGKTHAHPRIALGKDTRRSSYMLECALAAGLAASGADAYLLHVTTTPAISFVTREEGFAGGVMISASHNPFSDNGIKLINQNGEKADDVLIGQIEDFLDMPDPGDAFLPAARGEGIGRVIDHTAGGNRYLAYLLSLARHSFRGLRVGLDCANGSAFRIAQALFSALGAQIFPIGAAPDGLNINQNVGSTHIDALADLVKRQQLDVGFAFDGDADRCLAVDERGEVVTGDHILYVLAMEWRRRGLLKQDTVVTTVMSNMGLWRALGDMGMRTITTSVGDKYVYEAMAKEGSCLGGEQSGHIILRPFANTGDGLLTAMMLADVMVDQKLPLSRLTAGIRLYPQRTYNFKTDQKEAILHHPSVMAALERAERTLSGRGRILLRASGTEPLVRLMVEAETEEQCQIAVEEVLSAMKTVAGEV